MASNLKILLGKIRSYVSGNDMENLQKGKNQRGEHERKY